MFYSETAPPPDLQRWIHSFWQFSAPADLQGAYPHRVLPDGCVSLVWASNAGTMIVTGPRLEAYEVEIRANDQFYGARLRAGTARALLEPGRSDPFPDLSELEGPLSFLVPAYGVDLHRKLREVVETADLFGAIQEEVRVWVARAAPLDAAVFDAVAILRTATHKSVMSPRRWR